MTTIILFICLKTIPSEKTKKYNFVNYMKFQNSANCFSFIYCDN